MYDIYRQAGVPVATPEQYIHGCAGHFSRVREVQLENPIQLLRLSTPGVPTVVVTIPPESSVSMRASGRVSGRAGERASARCEIRSKDLIIRAAWQRIAQRPVTRLVERQLVTARKRYQVPHNRETIKRFNCGRYCRR